MFGIADELAKQLLVKILVISVVVLSVVGFGAYKYGQYKEEQIKEKYVEELNTQRKAYDSQIEQINKVNAESLEKQKLLLEEYKNHLDFVQAEYEQKVKELEDLRATKIKELTKKINQDPEVVLDDLAHKFGFEVIKVEED